MHDRLDRASLEMGRRIAAGLPTRPDWPALAKDDLARWKTRNAGAPGLLRCYAEWEAVLFRPLPEIIGVLTDASHEGQRLRQRSPFAGNLSPREVWEIKPRAWGDQSAS